MMTDLTVQNETCVSVRCADQVAPMIGKRTAVIRIPESSVTTSPCLVNLLEHQLQIWLPCDPPPNVGNLPDLNSAAQCF